MLIICGMKLNLICMVIGILPRIKPK